MAIFISAYMRRVTEHTITFKDADGVAITVLAGDKIRVKIGRAGEAPILDIISSAPVVTGVSSLTTSNPSTLKFGVSDLDLSKIKPGVYDLEASIIDSADGNKLKHAESGVFSLHDTPLGGVT